MTVLCHVLLSPRGSIEQGPQLFKWSFEWRKVLQNKNGVESTRIGTFRQLWSDCLLHYRDGSDSVSATKGEEDCDKIISKIAVVCKKQSKNLVKAFPQQDRLGVTWAEVHQSRIRINQPISFRKKAKLTTKHHLIMLITSHFMFCVVIVIELTRSHIRTPTWPVHAHAWS